MEKDVAKLQQPQAEIEGELQKYLKHFKCLTYS